MPRRARRPISPPKLRRNWVRRIQRRRAINRLRGKPKMANTHLFKRQAQDIIVKNIDLGGVYDMNIPGNPTVSTLTTSADDFEQRQGGFGLQFQLDQCLQYNELTSLFDRYKIVGVKLKFLFQCNTNFYDGDTHAQPPLPVINYAYDCDDNSAISDKLAVTTKYYCKERLLNGNRTFSVFYKPRIDQAIYQDGLVTAYTSERRKWIDCNNPSVPHYGMKIWINNWSVTPASAHKLTITPTYYLAMKDSQ